MPTLPESYTESQPKSPQTESGGGSIAKVLASDVVHIEGFLTIGKNLGAPVSEGSGFYIDSKGHVVTAAHVVELGSSLIPNVFVTRTGKRMLPARIDRIDDINDIAVLKTDRTPVYIKPMKIAPAKTPLRKMSAIAIFGYLRSESRVYVSAGLYLGQERLMDFWDGPFTGNPISAVCSMIALNDAKQLDLKLAKWPPSTKVEAKLANLSDGFKQLESKLLVTSALVRHGFSGGPVVSESGSLKNQVVGITLIKIGQLSYVRPIKYLQTLMQDKHPEFHFQYRRDKTGSYILMGTTRSDGTVRPPYHYQLVSRLYNKCQF